jgi:hypothetical protein
LLLRIQRLICHAIQHKNKFTGTTIGAVTACLSGAIEFTLIFYWGSCSIFSFLCNVDPFIPLVSSNFSEQSKKYRNEGGNWQSGQHIFNLQPCWPSWMKGKLIRQNFGRVPFKDYHDRGQGLAKIRWSFLSCVMSKIGQFNR